MVFMNRRLMIAKSVSKIGTPKIAIGTINENNVAFLNPKIDRTPIIYPKNSALYRP